MEDKTWYLALAKIPVPDDRLDDVDMERVGGTHDCYQDAGLHFLSTDPTEAQDEFARSTRGMAEFRLIPLSSSLWGDTTTGDPEDIRRGFVEVSDEVTA